MRLVSALLAVVLIAGPSVAQIEADAELRKEAGNYFLKKRQYDAARDQYLAALQRDPGYADAHYNLGVVYFFRLQDYPRALYHFVRYARLRPDAPDLDQVRSLTAQALEKIEAEEREAYEEALEEFLRAHEESSYAPDARDKLRALREYEEQVRDRERAIQEAYLAALAKGSPEAMEAFVADHPGAPQAAEARRLRDLWADQRSADELALEQARQEQTPEALDRFLSQRPQSHLAAQAQAERDRLRASEDAFRIAAEARSGPALEVFLATYQGTPREAQARALLEEIRGEEATQRSTAEAFRTASATGTIAALEAFLAEHPGSEWDGPARTRLAELKNEATRRQAEAEATARQEEARRQAEAEAAARQEDARRQAAVEAAALAARDAADRAWNDADAANTAAAYRDFQDRFGAHPMAEEARRREAVLSAAAPPPPPPPAEPAIAAPAASGDETGGAWARALEEDTAGGYERFLAAHPDGDEAAAARVRLGELQSGGPEDASEVPREKRRSLDRYRRMLQSE